MSGHPAPARALGYLYVRTAVNRGRQQLQRLRSPRYLVALALGATYLWWALIRNTQGVESPLPGLVTSDGFGTVASLLLLLSAARWWLFDADRGALAFTPAEVHFLFAAPVSRRTLILARLLRLQLAILANTVVLTVLLRAGAGNLAAWQRALALWTLFSTVAIHRLGAAIVRRSAATEGLVGVRRHGGALLVFGAMAIALGIGLFDAVAAGRAASAGGVRELVSVLVDALQAPLPAAALQPATWLLAPVTAAGRAPWGAAMVPALLLLLGHVVWVLRLDRGFEEAALEASRYRAERLLRLRSAQPGMQRSRRGALTAIPPLPAWGPPEMAIVWKNVAAALRGGSWRSQLLLMVGIMTVLGTVGIRMARGVDEAVYGMITVWAIMMLFLGPLWLRTDLRLDLPRLDQLKSLPIPGWRLVAAEIVTVTVLHSISVWTLLALPFVLALVDPAALAGRLPGAPLVVAAALGVPAINALQFTIHNGMALLFPAWVRLGAEPRGIEVLGQNLLTTGAATFVAAVALVFPVGVTALVLWLADAGEGWGLAAAVFAGSLLLLLELWPVLHWLGEHFETMDPREVAATG